jgi:hypothetical protein
MMGAVRSAVVHSHKRSWFARLVDARNRSFSQRTVRADFSFFGQLFEQLPDTAVVFTSLFSLFLYCCDLSVYKFFVVLVHGTAA